MTAIGIGGRFRGPGRRPEPLALVRPPQRADRTAAGRADLDPFSAREKEDTERSLAPLTATTRQAVTGSPARQPWPVRPRARVCRHPGSADDPTRPHRAGAALHRPERLAAALRRAAACRRDGAAGRDPLPRPPRRSLRPAMGPGTRLPPAPGRHGRMLAGCSGVDPVAVGRDGVCWLDPPSLEARVGHQRLGEGFRSGDQGAVQVDLGGDAPGVVLGPEQVG